MSENIIDWQDVDQVVLSRKKEIGRVWSTRMKSYEVKILLYIDFFKLMLFTLNKHLSLNANLALISERKVFGSLML